VLSKRSGLDGNSMLEADNVSDISDLPQSQPTSTTTGELTNAESGITNASKMVD
jgi:hypothetical protein